MHVPEVTPDLPGPTWRAILALLGRLPQATLSRGLGAVADVPIPRMMRGAVLRAFAKALSIDVSEAEKPLGSYPSINDFFVRRLRPGSRRWPSEPGVTSPVDGVVGQIGTVDRGRIIQAKGRSYSATDLLDDPEAASRFDGGLFATLYLSPKHYHRVHAPVAGRVGEARYVSGGLLPVNRAAVQHVESLFAKNERLHCVIEASAGAAAVVAVGAYNVGRISTAFDPAWAGPQGPPWVTNRTDEVPTHRSYDPPIDIGRGDEMMAFHLGSTVILLLEPGRYAFTRACTPGADIQLGALIARPTESSS